MKVCRAAWWGRRKFEPWNRLNETRRSKRTYWLVCAGSVASRNMDLLRCTVEHKSTLTCIVTFTCLNFGNVNMK